MEKVIITNATWFRKYLFVRRIVLVMVFFAILLMIEPELVSDGIRHIVQGASLSFLVALLVFDFIQRPTLFELKQKDEKLILGLYFPDYRYFINFDRNRVKYFHIHKDEKLSFNINTYVLNLLNNAQIEVIQNNGGVASFRHINFSWANQREINKVLQVINSHNNSIGT